MKKNLESFMKFRMLFQALGTFLLDFQDAFIIQIFPKWISFPHNKR